MGLPVYIIVTPLYRLKRRSRYLLYIRQSRFEEQEEGKLVTFLRRLILPHRRPEYFTNAPTIQDRISPLPIMQKKTTIGEIESHLKKKCTEKGWACKKFSGSKKKGIPDCVITAPGGMLLYVEVKVPGKKATPLQRNDSLSASHGIHVFVVTSKENIDVLLNTFQAAIDADNGMKI